MVECKVLVLACQLAIFSQLALLCPRVLDYCLAQQNVACDRFSVRKHLVQIAYSFSRKELTQRVVFEGCCFGVYRQEITIVVLQTTVNGGNWAQLGPEAKPHCS